MKERLSVRTSAGSRMFNAQFPASPTPFCRRSTLRFLQDHRGQSDQSRNTGTDRTHGGSGAGSGKGGSVKGGGHVAGIQAVSDGVGAGRQYGVVGTGAELSDDGGLCGVLGGGDGSALGTVELGAKAGRNADSLCVSKFNMAILRQEREVTYSIGLLLPCSRR